MEKDEEPMETIEMCELVKQGEGEELETQLIQTTTANGQPQLIQVVTTTNSAGHLIATPVSQIQEWGKIYSWSEYSRQFRVLSKLITNFAQNLFDKYKNPK